jgi:L-idonate 5-dehydrogenase
VHRAGDLLGRTVLITGGGTIGCMSVLAARLAGAAKVVVCDIAERPLEMARRVGADVALRSDQAAAAELTDVADIAIEAAGSPRPSRPACRRRGAAGRIVQVGTLARRRDHVSRPTA